MNLAFQRGKQLSHLLTSAHPPLGLGDLREPLDPFIPQTGLCDFGFDVEQTPPPMRQGAREPRLRPRLLGGIEVGCATRLCSVPREPRQETALKPFSLSCGATFAP